MSYLLSARCDVLKCPGVAKNVLMALADMANDSGYTWPTIERLCQRTDWSYTAVVDALAWLEANGAIRRGRSNRRKTVYWLTPEQYAGDRHPPPKNLADPTVALFGTPNGATAVSSPDLRVRQPDPSATRTSPPHGPVGPPTGPSESASRTLTTNNHHEHKPPNPPAGGAPGFAEFFAGYPRQVDEANARRAWERLAPDEALRGVMAAAVAAWRRSDEWQRDNGRYVPKPGNWLRNRRWLDVPGTVQAAPPAPEPTLPPRKALSDDELRANAAKARAIRERCLAAVEVAQA